MNSVPFEAEVPQGKLILSYTDNVIIINAKTLQENTKKSIQVAKATFRDI